MSMLHAPASFQTSCSAFSKIPPGRVFPLAWRHETRAKAYGSMSRLACVGCGARIKSPPWGSEPAQAQRPRSSGGLVERVTFHNEENGFCVLRVKAQGQRDLITVLGHAAIAVRRPLVR